MQKENRNNRVHTGDRSGKTEFPIMNLLPVGKENAISTKDLVQLTGCGSARELQQYIATERSRGAVICSSTTGGYFLPANHKEIAEFCKALENRAKNTFLALRSAKQSLKVPEGQQVIESEVREDDE